MCLIKKLKYIYVYICQSKRWYVVGKPRSEDTRERDAFKAFSDEATSDTKANTRRMQLKLLSWLLSTSSFREFLHSFLLSDIFFFFIFPFFWNDRDFEKRRIKIGDWLVVVGNIMDKRIGCCRSVSYDFAFDLRFWPCFHDKETGTCSQVVSRISVRYIRVIMRKEKWSRDFSTSRSNWFDTCRGTIIARDKARKIFEKIDQQRFFDRFDGLPHQRLSFDTLRENCRRYACILPLSTWAVKWNIIDYARSIHGWAIGSSTRLDESKKKLRLPQLAKERGYWQPIGVLRGLPSDKVQHRPLAPGRDLPAEPSSTASRYAEKQTQISVIRFLVVTIN